MNNILIFSDIHGSLNDLKAMEKVIKYNNFEKIIILGDLYYSGPRNIPTSSYSPKDCVEILNKYSDKIIWIKGNCDSYVDQMVNTFQVYDDFQMSLNYNNKVVKIFLHHGHFDNKDKIKDVDIVFYGHTHIKRFEKVDNTTFINPGSISLPKDSSKSYIIFNPINLTCSFYTLNTNEQLSSYKIDIN